MCEPHFGLSLKGLMYLLLLGELGLGNRWRSRIRIPPGSASVLQEKGCMGKMACLRDREGEDICRKALSPPGKSHAKCLSQCMPAASQSPMVASVYLPHPYGLPQVAAGRPLLLLTRNPLAQLKASIRQLPLLPLGRESNISMRERV